MKKENWYFIVNPEAGGERVKRNWPKLKAQLEAKKIGYNYVMTQASEHAYELVSDAAELGFRKFVVVGGDGSVNEVVNAFMFQNFASIEEFTLKVVPWGTGNDWAAFHGIDAKISSCIDVLKQPELIQHDLGCVSYFENEINKQHWFINFIGAGMDSYVLNEMQGGGGSRLNYYKAALKGLLRYRSPEFYLTVNNKRTSIRSLMLMACNGKFGGAGMIFAPEAKIDDGLLNVLSIGDMSVVKRLLSFRYLLTGKINQHPEVTTNISSSLLIDSDIPIVFQCDGELVGQLPIEIECLQKKLKVAI